MTVTANRLYCLLKLTWERCGSGIRTVIATWMGMVIFITGAVAFLYLNVLYNAIPYFTTIPPTITMSPDLALLRFECFCVLFATRGMFYIAPDGTVAISFGNLIVSCICGVCLWYLGMYIWGVEVTITDARRIIKMLFGWLCVVFFVIKPSFYVAPVENTPFEVLAFNFGIVSLIVYSLCALIMWYVGTYIGRKVIDFFGGVSNNDPTIQN